MTPPLNFGTGEPPPLPDEDDPITSTDLVCEFPGCSTPLTYAGKGRKPTRCDEHKGKRIGSSSSTAKGRVSDADLNNACDSLRLLYDGVTLPLVFASPNAAKTWRAQVDWLDEQNRTTLANNRDLVRKINSAGEKGGTYLFVGTHVAAIAPVMIALYMDITGSTRERKAARAQEQASTSQSWTATVVSDDPAQAAGYDPADPDATFNLRKSGA